MKNRGWVHSADFVCNGSKKSLDTPGACGKKDQCGGSHWEETGSGWVEL